MRASSLALVLALSLGPTAPGLAAPAESNQESPGPDVHPEWTVAAPAKRLPRPLRKAIRAGVEQLQAGELVAFLRQWVHPEDQERMPDLEQVAEGFAGEKVRRLIAAFEAVERARTWRMQGPDGRTGYAVEVTALVEGLPRDLLLEEVDGLWRIHD